MTKDLTSEQLVFLKKMLDRERESTKMLEANPMIYDWDIMLKYISLIDLMKEYIGYPEDNTPDMDGFFCSDREFFCSDFFFDCVDDYCRDKIDFNGFIDRLKIADGPETVVLDGI